MPDAVIGDVLRHLAASADDRLTPRPRLERIREAARNLALAEVAPAYRSPRHRFRHIVHARFGHGVVPEFLGRRASGRISTRELTKLYRICRHCPDCDGLMTRLEAAEWALILALTQALGKQGRTAGAGTPESLGIDGVREPPMSDCPVPPPATAPPSGPPPSPPRPSATPGASFPDPPPTAAVAALGTSREIADVSNVAALRRKPPSRRTLVPVAAAAFLALGGGWAIAAHALFDQMNTSHHAVSSAVDRRSQRRSSRRPLQPPVRTTHRPTAAPLPTEMPDLLLG